MSFALIQGPASRYADRSRCVGVLRMPATLAPSCRHWIRRSSHSSPNVTSSYGRRIKALPQATAGADADLVEVELKVNGMVCENCSSRVQKALQELDIVKGASVSHESGLATLQVDVPSLYDAFNELPGFINAVTEQGFTAEPHFEDAPADE